jgi:hypothetical protein
MIDDKEIDKKNIAYSKQYDAYYNQVTNEWTESKCDDPNCEFCRRRPPHPLTLSTGTEQ